MPGIPEWMNHHPLLPLLARVRLAAGDQAEGYITARSFDSPPNYDITLDDGEIIRRVTDVQLIDAHPRNVKLGRRKQPPDSQTD